MYENSKCYSCCNSSGLRSLQASVALLAMTSALDSILQQIIEGHFEGDVATLLIDVRTYRSYFMMDENNVEIGNNVISKRGCNVGVLTLNIRFICVSKVST